MGTAAATVIGIGIDVSKATFDACLLTPEGTAREKAFPNTPAGFAALLAWADRHAAGAATALRDGGHRRVRGRESPAFLHAAGRLVSVVNPTRIKYAGVMRGRRNKTDKADARLIAEFTRDQRPAGVDARRLPEVRELQAFVRRRDDLRTTRRGHEKARLESPLLTPAARKSVARVVKLLGRGGRRHAGGRRRAHHRHPDPGCRRGHCSPQHPGGGERRRPRPSWPNCQPVDAGAERPRPRRRTVDCPRGSSSSGASVRGRTRLSEGGERPAAEGAVPADPDRDPLQSRPSSPDSSTAW